MEDDQDIWERYIKNVSPLGAPRRPSVYFPIVFRPTLPKELDLHGLPIQEAFHTTLTFLTRVKDHHSEVIVITGRSGTIRREFPHWIAHRPEVRKYEPTNGDGAFRILLAGSTIKSKSRRGTL